MDYILKNGSNQSAQSDSLTLAAGFRRYVSLCLAKGVRYNLLYSR